MSALIVFGAISFNKLGVSQMPDVDFPILSVSVDYEGASPEVVEGELIDKIEEELLVIEGIKEMRSTVRQGGGSVRLEFDIDRDIDVVLQEAQTALSTIRLPEGVDPPRIRKQNPEESPIMFIGITGDRPIREVVRWTEDFLLDQFRFLPGAGEISIGGFSERNLRIWPNPDKLKQYDLTVLDILDAIQTQHLETAAGQFSQGSKELRVRWLGEASTPAEVGAIRILRRGGSIIQDKVIKLQDVADIEDGLSDRRRIAKINGKEAISISVKKQRGVNEVAFSKTVREKVESLQKDLPADIKVQVNVDFTRSTKAVVDTTYEKLGIAALVTILICFLFLGSWQAAVNILFSIPTSIVGTFIILYFSGFTLNLFSLLALTLAISIVVDDAIMILENIVRHYRMGKSATVAAYEGSMEILPAASAATLAVVAIFIPVVFMDGLIGKFFFQFGVTMSAAVLLSLVEAVTITPMRAAFLLSSGDKPSRLEHYLEEKFSAFGKLYARTLGGSLRYPWLVVFVSAVLFMGSLFSANKLRQEFVPPQDQDLIIINAQTPTGSTLETAEAASREIEKILAAKPYVRSFFSSVGAGGPSSEVNRMFIPVNLIPREERKETHLQLMDDLRKDFRELKNIRVSMRDNSARNLTSGSQSPLSFYLRGPDLEILRTKAEEISKRLETDGYAVDMDVDFKVGLPELVLIPNRDAMASYGVSIEAVARTLAATVAGARQSRFTADGRRYDIRVKLKDDRIQSSKDFEKIMVRNQFGLQVPLAKLVTFKEQTTYQAVTRVNRQRAVSVAGNIAPGGSQGAAITRAREIAREVLPEGYSLELEGASAGLTESFQSLLLALILGVVVAYMILAVQFNSFIHPITILVALPFSVTGALLILWAFSISLNLFSFIGIIVLMGIAKKNSILLVEFANRLRAEGEKNVSFALQKAGEIRIRPILMTSCATVVAALPLVFGDSIGQETRTPMGLTIIGGTIVGTLFTLVVVPSLYLLFSRMERQPK